MAAPSGRVTVTLSVTGLAQIAALLEKLPIAIRSNELGRSLKTGARLVIRRAKQLVPKPGYPGDKTKKRPELTPLRDTIDMVYRNYQGGLVQGVVIGPVYSQTEGGNHGHLVELGHRIGRGGSLIPQPHSKRTTAPRGVGGRGTGRHVGNVPPHPFMAPAWGDTKDHFEPTIMTSLERAIVRAGG